jgi:hypothetical protein
VAFSDPQSVTINSVAQSLPRTSSGEFSGVFSKDDGSVQLKVRHRYGKRTRREMQLIHTKIAPDPLISSTNIIHSMSVYFAMDVPVTGYTVAEAKQIGDALTAYLTASSGARLTQFLGGES